MYAKYDTELTVRPHEIDYNRHVHQSVYLDYILYARVDQMRRCYKTPIEDFFKRGYSWATKSTSITFHKSLFMGDRVIVRTWVDKIQTSSVGIRFQILRKPTEDICAEGSAVYILVSAATGKPEAIPDDLRSRYSV